jgi:hypothetical protein
MMTNTTSFGSASNTAKSMLAKNPKQQKQQKPSQQQQQHSSATSAAYSDSPDLSLFGGATSNVGFFSHVPVDSNASPFFSQAFEEQQRVLEIERERQRARHEERIALCPAVHIQNDEDPYGICETLTQLVLFDNVERMSLSLSRVCVCAHASNTSGTHR